MASRPLTAGCCRAHRHGQWRGRLPLLGRAGSFTIEVDEPVGVGGTDLGPQPTDLFLASVASCFLMALSHAARKRAIELSDLSVDVTGSYDGHAIQRDPRAGLRRGARGRAGPAGPRSPSGSAT